MAMKMVTVNQFAQAYRKFSGESVSVTELMSNPGHASSMARKALLLENTILTPLATVLLKELGVPLPLENLQKQTAAVSPGLSKSTSREIISSSPPVRGEVHRAEVHRAEVHRAEAQKEISKKTSKEASIIESAKKTTDSSRSQAEMWEQLATSAREICGPMGGAIVLKYHRENPTVLAEEAVFAIKEKLGDKGSEVLRFFKSHF